ncbi:MAG: septum formation protein Maf [Clostridia bacterium]|nr:septum formation protein Maf [Clostridia bacterium]
MKYILASASPRRNELFKFIVDKFECLPADIAEDVPGHIDTFSAPEYLAVQKALHVAKQNSDAIVIGSDTSVFIEDMMLGKPSSADDAFKMLSLLSGRSHKVITGCAICYGNKSMSFCATSVVEFYDLSEKEIRDYIATGECFDKAGAYGIQGYGSTLVKEIHGDYFNIVGLPVARLKKELQNFRKIWDLYE